MTTQGYPESRTVDATEDAAGVRFADPYRWLEEDSEEVRLWQKAQADLASGYVQDWPNRGRVRELVQMCSSERVGSVPRFAAGQWFRAHTLDDGAYPTVLVADDPYGDGRVLADLADYARGEELPFLSWLSPSPDGRTLAIGVCTDGSEQNTIHLIDVSTGQPLTGAPPQVLHDGWTGGAAWLPDSSGFYYTALAGSVHEFRQAVFLHRLGAPAPIEPERLPLPEGSRDYTLIQISRDGRWAVAVHRVMNPIPVAIRDLSDPAASWKPFITDVTGTVAGYVLNDRYVAVTDVAAPRGRLVAIPLDSAVANDPSRWTDLIPESDAVLRAVTPVGDHLYVNEYVDTYSRVRILSLAGRDVGEVPLPGKGALAELPFPLMGLVPRGHSGEFVFAFSTLTSSPAVYRHRPGRADLETLREPATTLDAVIEDHWATSADGTRIPYHLVRPVAPDAAGPMPTLVYAYGGFNTPLVPQYSSAMAAFVAAGGLFVHAHLRGGAEFGRDWWEGGRFGNKQNCFADLYAVAEDLVEEGVTTTGQLALTGASNGGLLSGVGIAQRPDLWRVVVPQMPLLDLIGALRDPYGANGIRLEFADPDDPDEVRRLGEFSPYHLIRVDTDYPAVYINAGDTDPRCPPWHARKFAARLQAARSGDEPVLLHVWNNVGHGWATQKDVALEQTTEWLSFTLMTLGMAP